ncbi:MAG TPA: DUF2298 domain-containing protein [Ardenticatenaceae bacterium]|jgi:YYY domain-containing protein
MLSFALWYLTLALFGLAALPLGWTWFRHLPDRGWGLLRPLGLLLVGFAVWLAGSFGLLRLSAGSGIAGLVALFGVGVWALHRWGGGWEPLRLWLREHRTLLIAEEVLFLAAFAFWVWYRIHESYGIAHTEQPMDFALFNAIRRGGEIPPNDPWLSGFAISYYYLGYLIMAQVAALNGVISGIAYNLAFTSLAAMASLGVFSLGYNLIAGETAPEGSPRPRAMLVALLGPLLLLGISNLTGVLTMLYDRSMGPNALFQWARINDLTIDPATGERASRSWWWWAASRTLSDFGPDGGRIEVIDEFPFFSFLLGDMHPHVLALPFVLLGVTVALNGLRGAFASLAARQREGVLLPPESWTAPRDGLGRLALGLAAVLLGALYMMNTWDFPTLAAVLLGTWLVAALVAAPPGSLRPALTGWLKAAVLRIFGAMLLALPFSVGFRSQAQGIRFSPFSTLPQHYLLMFGLFWLVLVPLVLSQARRVAETLRTVSGRTVAVITAMLVIDGFALFFLLRSGVNEGVQALMMAAFWVLIPFGLIALTGDEDPTPLAIAQLAGLPLVAGLAAQRWTTAMVAFLLILTLLALWARVRALMPGGARATEPSAEMVPTRPAIAGGSQAAVLEDVALEEAPRPISLLGESSLLFALGLTAIALLLTMGSEIFYIEDGFPGRMNTIFKLYYQAWTLMAIASVFGLVYLARRAPTLLRVPWLALVGLLVVASMWYPAAALTSKANFNGPAHWDGRYWMQASNPDRFAAIEWLNSLPGQVVILERPGDQYNSEHSALAGWTGHSTLVGWGAHELQWRGTYDEVALREPVIQNIYQSTDPALARVLLDQWNIDYVAVTPLEIEKYGLSGRQLEKFNEFMTPVFQQGSVTIYGR